MSKAKSDRKAVVDQIRKQQSRTEQRRGLVIVGACVLVALVIVGAAAFKPLRDWWSLRSYDGMALAEIGAKASSCEDITTKPAEGNQDHVPVGTQLTYDDAPPAFGKHWERWDGMERKLYTTADRPELGELLHNLEHGFAILWYDETAAKDAGMMDDIRGIASKLGGTENLRNKFKAVPWTSEDGKAFPKGQHIALTRWSSGGVGETDPAKQVGVWQYCSAPSGAALEEFMEKYPYMDSPEPTAV